MEGGVLRFEGWHNWKNMGETGEKRRAIFLKEWISVFIKVRKEGKKKITSTVKFTLFLISGYEANMCFKDVFFHFTSAAAATAP